MPANPDIDNCEFEGVLGTLGGLIGTIQANEAIKEIFGGKFNDNINGHNFIRKT